MGNYFKPFYNAEMLVMDDRAFEKGRRPMTASILLTKGCVAKCTFCQRGSKGYTVYDLDKLETHLKDLRDNYNVGFLTVDDENFGEPTGNQINGAVFSQQPDTSTIPSWRLKT